MVTAIKNGITNEFSCSQWSLLPAGHGWEAVTNTCGSTFESIYPPFANNGYIGETEIQDGGGGEDPELPDLAGGFFMGGFRQLFDGSTNPLVLTASLMPEDETYVKVWENGQKLFLGAQYNLDSDNNEVELLISPIPSYEVIWWRVKPNEYVRRYCTFHQQFYTDDLSGMVIPVTENGGVMYLDNTPAFVWVFENGQKMVEGAGYEFDGSTLQLLVAPIPNAIYDVHFWCPPEIEYDYWETVSVAGSAIVERTIEMPACVKVASYCGWLHVYENGKKLAKNDEYFINNGNVVLKFNPIPGALYIVEFLRY